MRFVLKRNKIQVNLPLAKTLICFANTFDMSPLLICFF